MGETFSVYMVLPRKMTSRTKGHQCLLCLFFGVVLALGQAASAAPNMPGHIEVGKVTATTAVVHWGAPVVEEGVRVFYLDNREVVV